ncbi:hypothetical protein FIBSPDRAFT_961137 [Athelia psychrophila]|uniref:Rhodopsin domain-containing protein n=1 Tax=Athelia psychrophila TaxID=1759441 RepID=A0A166BNJ8_9AGAM|nr:hypothetical protein FIBSPDRAFT_961137 [Fibularhizoctonia sp. CBS 109695]
MPFPSLLLSAQVVSTVFPCLAISITAFRLVIQYRRSQLWWEDLWAAVAMACIIGVVSAYWWFSIIVAKPHPDISSFVVAWWLSTSTFTCALWAARMSLTFSIIRISHPASRLRIVANLTAGLFACCFTSQIIQKVYICKDVKSWMNNTAHGCDIGNGVGIAEICMDAVSDFLLMAIASRLLRDARQLKSQRKLIRGLFSASILTTVFSVVHIVFVIQAEVLLAIIMTGHLEVSISLIVCNLPVVVTCFYRRFRRMHAEDAYDYATGTSSDRAPLENTLDTSAATQIGLISSADIETSLSTQSMNAFQSHDPK